MEVPAQIAVCKGKLRAVGDSKGYPVDVGPRLGMEAGMEVIMHTVGTGNPGRVRKEQKKLSGLKTGNSMYKAITGSIF